ncbi:WD repeat-containing protein 43 [Agrilus planipennis]|uniref:WD repeat-containing protein 43 n=1 Tax=Agrilus planipennis TaxID=224129 RepID=A0A1W4X340_AGRPL|nr:WD repeat-containing protein 43 [Agrilus planipennis]
MASQFSEDCKYYAHLSSDGKLKIWHTSTSTLEQEFTPEFHLTAPCTCIHFISSTSLRKEASPRKKKKRDSLEVAPYIALGTSSGKLLLYSVGKADLESNINSNTNQSINCLSWNVGNLIYSGVEQNIICWDLEKKSIRSKWKAGSEVVTSILEVPTSNRLLTASRSIKLWNVDTKELLHIYTGHTHDVILLHYINPRNSSEAYFLSGSKEDRIVNCWSVSESVEEKNSLVSFVLDDAPKDISVAVNADGSTYLSATSRNGVAHIFRHTLNGRSNKPLKPKQTIQVVSNTSENEGTVIPIPILCATIGDNMRLLIGHGNHVMMTFESVIITDHEKVQCLIRKDPRSILSNKSKGKSNSKVKTPVTNDAHYLTPFSSTNTVKRRNDGTQEVPMEKRLENLTLNKVGNKSEASQMENLAHLLVQGLHSKDKFLLTNVFQRRDENIIRNTVKRLPLPVIIPLIEELTAMIQGKTLSSKIGAIWLHYLVQNNAGLLISNPDISAILGPVIGNIESRLSLQAPLSKLKGRLSLLLSQVTSFNSEESNHNEEPILVYNDKGSSDLDLEAMDYGVHVDSDNEWVEEDTAEEDSEQEDNDDEAQQSDSEMST